MRNQEPVNANLAAQYKQLAPHLSPLGVDTLSSQQGALCREWDALKGTVAERDRVLREAVQEKKVFYGKLEEAEKWTQKMQRGLDSSGEVYADAVPNTLTDIKVNYISLMAYHIYSAIHRRVN